MDVNSPTEQTDVRETYGTSYPKTAESVFFKCTWNIFWDRPYIRPQSKSEKQIREDCTYMDYLLWLEHHETGNKRKTGIFANTWKSNNKENNEGIGENKSGSYKVFWDEKLNIPTYQNIQAATRAVPRRKFLTITTHSKEIQMHNLILRPERTRKRTKEAQS